MRIVAIGGGEIKGGETLPLDRLVVDFTGKSRPQALFVPTASGDAPGYCQSFDEVYGARLGCRTRHLLLCSTLPAPATVSELIEAADLIYVGGGNTLRMLAAWRRLGVDRLLEAAARRGTVLAGLSAGAICWHQWGHSDSRSSAGGGWQYIRVRALGFCRGVYCPHLDSERRAEPFGEMIARRGGIGLACDDGAAICYDRGTATVRTARRQAMVHIYRRIRGIVGVESRPDGEPLEMCGAVLPSDEGESRIRGAAAKARLDC